MPNINANNWATSIQRYITNGSQKFAGPLADSYRELSAYASREAARLATRYEERIASLLATGAFGTREAAAAHLLALNFQREEMERLAREIDKRIGKLSRLSNKVNGVLDESVRGATKAADSILRSTISPLSTRSFRGKDFPMGAWQSHNARAYAAIVQNTKGVVGDLFNRIAGEGYGQLAAQTLRNSLGVGNHPFQTARLLEKQLSVPYWRAATIARTEQLRATRAATLESMNEAYRLGAPLIGYVWMSARDRTTCAACWSQDGKVTKFSEATGVLNWVNDHPNGRCTYVPLFEGETADDVLGSAEAEFRSLPVADQQAILGPTRFKAYEKGVLGFEEFGVVNSNPVWGNTLGMRKTQEIRDLISPDVPAPVADAVDIPGGGPDAYSADEALYGEWVADLPVGMPHVGPGNPEMAYDLAKNDANRRAAKQAIQNSLTDRMLADDYEAIARSFRAAFERNPEPFAYHIIARLDPSIDLTSRQWKALAESERFARLEPEFAKFMADPDRVRFTVYHLVDDFVRSWAHSSSSPESLLVKRRVAALFDMDAAAMTEQALGGWEDAFWYAVKRNASEMGIKDYEKLALARFARAVDYDVFDGFLDALARAQYNATQEWFAARNITEIRLFRGMRLMSESGRRVDWADALIEGQEVFRDDVTFNALSSFSFHGPTAFNFASDDRGGALLDAVLPVSRIFSTARTGFGCLNEFECVVMPTRVRWRVWWTDGLYRRSRSFLQKFVSWW